VVANQRTQNSAFLDQGKLSTTAYIIAASLVKLARMPKWRQYFNDEMILLYTAFSQYAKDSVIKNIINALPPRVAICLMDSFFIPGLMQYYLIRKRFIEQHTSQAIGNGFRQIINLGAGFDTLALRAAVAYPLVQFFEIDRPHTQAVKLSVLDRIHYTKPINCNFIEADLAKSPLNHVLSSINRIDTNAPTLVILEGVLMYLSEHEVTQLFNNLNSIFSSSLVVVFGATATSTAKGSVSQKIINGLLRRGGEGAKWSCSSQSMATFVEDCGYKLNEWIAYKKLHSLYQAESEMKNIPDEDENYYVIEAIKNTSTKAA
jgi:methyltransferase (TIGR00027 family)